MKGFLSAMAVFLGMLILIVTFLLRGWLAALSCEAGGALRSCMPPRLEDAGLSFFFWLLLTFGIGLILAGAAEMRKA